MILCVFVYRILWLDIYYRCFCCRATFVERKTAFAPTCAAVRAHSCAEYKIWQREYVNRSFHQSVMPAQRRRGDDDTTAAKSIAKAIRVPLFSPVPSMSCDGFSPRFGTLWTVSSLRFLANNVRWLEMNGL